MKLTNRFKINTENKWESLNEKNHYVIIKLDLVLDPAYENNRQANLEARKVEGECPSHRKLLGSSLSQE